MALSENIANQGDDPISLNSSSHTEPMANDAVFLNSASDTESVTIAYLSYLNGASPMFDHDVGPAFTMPTPAFPTSSQDDSNHSTAIPIEESRDIQSRVPDPHIARAPYPTSLPAPGSNPQARFPDSGNPQLQIPPTASQQSPKSRGNSTDRPDSESSSNSSNQASPASSNPTDSEVAQPNDTMSALHIASHRGHTSVLSILLTHDLDPNEPDGSGRPPLHLAATNGHSTVTSLLLSHGARINATDSLGRTALHWAVLRGHEAVVKVFLETGGADLNLRDRNDWSVLHVAVERGCGGVLRMLLRHGADLRLKARKCEGWKREEREVEDGAMEERLVMEG